MAEPPGTEAPDLAALARRFLDLWEDQVAALAADSDLAEQMRRFMLMLGMATAAGSALWAGRPGGERARGEAHGQDGVVPGDAEQARRKAAGAAAAALPPDGGGGDLAQLARRLADAERRIAELEAAAARGRRRAGGKSRKRRS